jgi:homoserine kinase
MTNREIIITRAILKVLHDDGGQWDELSIHRAINDPLGADAGASAAEVSAAISACDANGWLTGVPHKFTRKMRWNINDAGEAALLELTA